MDTTDNNFERATQGFDKTLVGSWEMVSDMADTLAEVGLYFTILHDEDESFSISFNEDDFFHLFKDDYIGIKVVY